MVVSAALIHCTGSFFFRLVTLSLFLSPHSSLGLAVVKAKSLCSHNSGVGSNLALGLSECVLVCCHEESLVVGAVDK
jgi:hypothetical protein